MKIAVLRGGPSKHYDTSLRTGEFVLSHLREEEHLHPIDIFISKDGEWHMMGRVVEPHHALRGVDLVWNALHGEYGEDGKLSQLLSQMQVPHTGSGALALSLSMHKDLTKRAYDNHGLLTPRHELLLGGVNEQDLLQIFREYLHPVMVKPVSGRGSLGVSRAHSFDELKHFVAEAFRHADRVMVEEFVRGKEVSCGVIEGFRGKSIYTLIPEPNNFTPETHKAIERMTELAHHSLGLRHYSYSDFIITPKGRIYILETNALPDLHKESLFHKSLNKVGATAKEFINHVISIAK